MLERRRWVSKSAKDITNTCVHFRPSDFLESMRGRRLYVLGDSIMTNFYTSLFCALYTLTESEHSVEFYRLPYCGELLCPLGNAQNSWNRGAKAYFRLYDFTLVHILEDHLHSAVKKLFLSGQVRSHDVIVYNSGLLYNDEYSYEVQMRAWYMSLLPFLNRTDAPQFFFMEISPQHFSFQENGYFVEQLASEATTEKAKCVLLYDPQKPGEIERIKSIDWRNQRMRKVLKPLIDQNLLTVIPIAEGL